MTTATTTVARPAHGHNNDTDLKGLTAWVYRSHGDFSNGGMSSRVEKVTVVGVIDRVYPAPVSTWQDVKPLPRESQVFTPTDEAPAVVFVLRNMGSTRLVHVEPLEREPEGSVGYMDGGTFVATSDSRFREMIGFYGAVSMHDRFETPEQYRRLSSD